MKKILPLLLFAALLFMQSCNTSDVTVTEKIDAKLKEQIRDKNDSLMVAFSSSDLAIYKELGSEKFVKNLQANTRIVSEPFRKGFFKAVFTVYDEFLVTNNGARDKIEIPSKHGYTFSFVNEEKQSLVSFLKVSRGQLDYLITVIYGYTNNKWQVNELYYSFLGNWGQTTPDFYKMAKQYEAKGMLLNAYLAANTAAVCSDSHNDNFTWNDVKRIKLYEKTLFAKVNEKYSFPITLTKVPTKPVVVSLEPNVIINETVPCINYQTSISIKDTIAIKKEQVEVKSAIKTIFKDLNFKSNMAYNAIPPEYKQSGATFVIIDKFEKK